MDVSHLSTEEEKAGEDPWVPEAAKNSWRQTGAHAQESEGAHPALTRMLSKRQRLPVRWYANMREMRIVPSRCFVLKYRRNDLGYNRFGMVMRKKVALRAVERNKWRRRFFSLAATVPEKGIDVLLIAAPCLTRENPDEFRAAFRSALRAAGA